MRFLLTRLWQDQRGQDMTEYALLGGLVACIAVAIVPEIMTISEHIRDLLHAVTQAAIDVAALK